MAKKYRTQGMQLTSVQVSEDRSLEVGRDSDTENPEDLVSWVVGKTSAWRNWRDSNYGDKWDQYEATFRGEFLGKIGQKQTGRSKIVSPASQQAVELCVSELEDAIFGRGEFFDVLTPAGGDPTQADLVKENLRADLQKVGFHRNISEALLVGAIYGTGITEQVMTEQEQLVPAAKEVSPGVVAVGTIKQASTLVIPRSVHPRNFLIDPTATNIDEALGVGIEEYVSLHLIEAEQSKGNYYNVEIAAASGDDELLPDSFTDEFTQDKVKRLRYYGKVSKHLLLEDAQETVPTEYIEAVVVVANDGTLLKAEESPYMMQDRPVRAFQLGVVPGSFYGMGMMEKAKNGQDALDAELRARIDSLAFVNSPMMAMDATKMPRGSKLDVFPGKLWLTNGNPAETFRDFKFGQLDGNTWQQSDYLERMVSQATGAVNPAEIARGIGDARSGAVSMVMSGIVKRYKRYAMNLFDQLVVPAVQQVLWRYMQFEPKRYPVQDYRIRIASDLGIMAKEYEQMQMIQVLQTLPPEASEARKALLVGIIRNSSLPQKEALIEKLSQPDPMALAAMQQQADPSIQALQLQQAQVALQLDIAEKQARIRKLNAEAGLAEARTVDVSQESQLEALRIAQRGLYAVEDDSERERLFDERYKLAQLALKDKDINTRAEISKRQLQMATDNNPAYLPVVEAPLVPDMAADGYPI